MDRSQFVNREEIIDSFNYLIKFGTKERLESLQKGNLYMNNLKYFNDLEKTSGISGMGDINDGKLVLNSLKIQLIDPNDDKKIIEFDTDKSMLEIGIAQLPVFCMYTIDKRNLIEEEIEDENTYIFKFGFKDEEKTKIQSSFGPYALMIKNHDEFIKRLTSAFRKNNFHYMGSKVLYSDFSINEKERIEDCSSNEFRFAYWKDYNKFEHQHEYRVLCTNNPVEKNMEIFIGDISDITLLLKTEDLFSYEFIVEASYKQDINKENS